MRRVCLIALPVLMLTGCGERQADPDLTGEAKIDAEAQSLDEAADEAARIVEEDSAKAIAEHRAEAAAAAAALYAGQQGQDGSGRQSANETP